MSETKLNLYQKIQKVSIEIMNLEKDMNVGQGSFSYKAVSDNQVTLAVKRAEEKYGLISIPIKQELISSEVVKSQKGDKESLTYVDNIKMTVRFINLENTEEHIDIESFGKGIDSGDKGFGKASTYARKYALLNAYKIATGEDPDKDKSETITQKTENDKKNEVIAVCSKSEKLKNNVLQHFNVGTLDDLSPAQIEVIYTQFKNQKYL